MSDIALIDDILTSRRSPGNPPPARADRVFEVFSQAAGVFLHDLLPDLTRMVSDWHRLSLDARPNGVRSVLGANEYLSVATAAGGKRAVILNALPCDASAAAVALEGRMPLTEMPGIAAPRVTRVSVFQTRDFTDDLGPEGFRGNDLLHSEADRLVHSDTLFHPFDYQIFLNLHTVTPFDPDAAPDLAARRLEAMRTGRLRAGAELFERLADLVAVAGGDLRESRATTA